MKTASRSAALAISIALSSLAAACYSPSIPDGKLACSTNGACPDNFTCASNGYCYANGAAVPPDAPTAVSATPGVRSANISWSAPANNGGSAITNYTVTAAPGGLSASSATTSATLSGLDNATAYTFTVVATNAIGNSPASAPSPSITTFGFPGAPTDLIAAAATNGATLDWTAPADSGGTPVTGYLVRVSFNGGAYTQVSPSISGTHATLTNLSGGGSYTFEVAAVNAVGAGDYSDPSSAITLAAVPNTPTIIAPATVSSGQINVAASVAANLGETYAWTITGGTLTNPDGAAGEIASGTDSIAFTVTAPPGGTVVLGCTATNSVGDSAPATFTAAVSSAPVQPTILADLNITIGDTGIVAKVAANPGMTYNWTLSSNATLASGDLHGTTANGFNSITYNLSGNAQVGAKVFLSAVEVNASQEMSGPGTFAQTIDAAPTTPIITAPLMVAASEVGATASVQDNQAMTYAWTLTGATFSAGSGAGGTVSGGNDSIQFDVTAAVNGSVMLSVVEINAANKQSAPATATVPVGALPSPLSISVSLDNGANPPQFQSGATQYATLNSTQIAEVAAVTGATYAWTISGGGSAASGETGTSRTFSFTATNASQPIQLGCTVALGSSNVVGSQTVTIVAAPVTPTVSLDGDGSSGFLEIGDTSSHAAAVTSPVSTSTYAWSATPAGDLLGLAASGTSVSFMLSQTAAAGDSIVLHAIETNAAGRVGTAGSGTFTVLGELQTPVIAASSQAVAPGSSYTATESPTQTGLTYQWAIAEVTDGVPGAAVDCPSASSNACTVNADHSLSFTVDPTLPTDGSVAIELQLTVTDQAGHMQSATPVELDVIALPVVAITFGAPPSGDAFGANIPVGGTREAFVASVAGATYLWSVSPGSIVSGGSSNDVVFSAGSAPADTTLALSVVATNAAGSSTGNEAVNVIAAAAAPTVSVPEFANDPGLPAYTSEQYTATLTPGSPAGVSYLWTVASSGSPGCNAPGALCGITPVSGANPSAGTFSYTVTAAVGATLSFSAVAIDAAGDAGATSNVATQMVIEPPTAPSIATTFTSPGAPTGVTFTEFAPGATYTLSVADVVSGLHYQWQIGTQTCPSASFCTDASGDGSYSSITLTANSSITSTQGNSPPQVGDTVSVVVDAIDSGGNSTASQPLAVNVIAAPSAPAIVVTDPEHPDGVNPATQQLAPGDADTAYADSDPSLTFAWTATDAEHASVLTSSASGTPASLTGGQSINEVSFTVPAFTSGEAVTFGLTVYNAASYASATPLVLDVNGSTPPTIDIPALDADVRSPPALTFGLQHAQVNVTPNSGDSIDCFPLDTNTTVENPNDTGGNGSTVSPFFIDVSSTPVVSGPQWLSTIECDELVAATGATLVSKLTVPLEPPLTVVAITPADGSTDVDVNVTPTILFSYPPDPTTLQISSTTCHGSVYIFNNSDSTCPSFTFVQDSTNKALFTAVHATPFESGASYLIDVATNAASPVADLQGVPLGQGLAVNFTTHQVPDVTSPAVTWHLQSADLSWTNPSDAQLNHVHIHAIPQDTTRGATDVYFDTTGAATSATVSGLYAGTSYEFLFQVAESADDSLLSAGVGIPGITAMSGSTSDFTASQKVIGDAPSPTAVGDNFFFTWGPSELYFGFEQSDLGTALRNPGDAIWIAFDVDPSGADSNGETSTPTQGTLSSGVPEQIIWPFRADYVLELKTPDGTSVIPRLRTVATNSWAPGPDSMVFDGTIAEGGALLGNLLPVGSTDVDAHVRLAMAFIAFSGTDATVIDTAPPASLGTPSVDVFGKLGSITNSIDIPNLTTLTAAPTPLRAATYTPAAALVTFSVVTTAALDRNGLPFSQNDIVQLFGNLPPFSYNLSDSSYLLYDDGTHGDSSANDGKFTGVFNLGVFSAEPSGSTANELFFEFADDSVAENLFGSGKDRVWTLSGANDSVGGGFIQWNQVYDLTHFFTLNFSVSNVPGADSPVVILGDQSPIGDWETPFDGSGDVTAGFQLTGSGTTFTGSLLMNDQDFVSGGTASNDKGVADPAGAPLNWQAVGWSGSINYEGSSNHTLNDDVINQRLLSWSWGDIVDF